MSYSVIGNDSIGLYHTDWYEVEVEDEDTGDYYETEIEGDFVREIEFVGYTFTADENSKSVSVEMYYYFRNPTSEYYWDMMYGDPPYPVIPLVVLIDTENKPVELLNTSFPAIVLNGKQNGWYGVTVPLKRKIKQGDRIYFAFGASIITPVYDETPRLPTKEDSYDAYFNKTGIFNYEKFHETVPESLVSGSLFNELTLYWDKGYRFSVYLKYENEPKSQNYEVTVIGNANVNTKVSKKAQYKKIPKSTIKNKEILSKKSVYKKKLINTFEVSDITYRMLDIVFSVASEFKTSDVNTNNRVIKRLLATSKKITSEIKSRMLFFRGFTEYKELTDETLRHLLISRSGIELLLIIDKFSRLLSFNRVIDFVADVKTELIRSGNSYRSTEDEIPITAEPFASRLFFRTVETVLSLWVWIRGKIRETNNIVSLYCPIYLEIEIEACL